MAFKQEESEKDNSEKIEKYNHLLIAKVKDTQILFSFIIDATLLE